MTQGHKRLRDWEIDYLQNNIGGVKREMQMIAGAMNPMNYPPEMFGQPNAKRRRQQGFCLNVSDLPEHVFLQKKIQLQIWVKDAVKNCITPAQGVYIKCELLHEDGTTADQTLLQVHSQQIVAKAGRAICDVSLMDLSMNHENRRFRLRFSTSNTIYSTHIDPCETRAFSIIARRVHIIEQPEEIWYKDEGGRHAALQCKYRVVDKENKIVPSDNLDMRVTLCYGNGKKAPESATGKNQGKRIFRILEHGPSKSQQGVRILRWRVEDVSRAHGLQKFCVHLQPDPHNPNSYDIAGCFTNKTEIKSKRKTQTSGKKKRMSGGAAGLITQATILQHIDASLNRFLRPLSDRITRIEQSLTHVVQKMDRMEHHLDMAPGGVAPKSEPGASLNAGGPAQRQNGGAPGDAELKRLSGIGQLPPPIGIGGELLGIGQFMHQARNSLTMQGKPIYVEQGRPVHMMPYHPGSHQGTPHGTPHGQPGKPMSG